MRSPLEKVTKASGAATAAFALWLAASSIFLPSPTLRAESGRYQYTPEPLEFPVKNPLYGWRGRRETPSYAKPPLNIFPADPEFESLKKWYIGWSEIEDDERDDVAKIRAFMDALWKDLPQRNEKAIPRLVLLDLKGNYIPKDLPPLKDFYESPWYTDPRVQPRIKRLISRLAEVWDNDPRVAWVEMGIQGKYGEHWGLAQMPEFAIWLCEEFQTAFRNKKLTFRNVGAVAWGKDTSVLQRIAREFSFGYYQDSFAFAPYEAELNAIEALDGGNRWKTAATGGEIRTEKNPVMTRQIGPNLSGSALQRLIDWTRRGHISHLGWDYNHFATDKDPQCLTGAIAMRRALGYHFVMTDYSQPRRVEPGETFSFSFSVKNTGSGAFYYNWPVAVSLHDEATHGGVFTQTLPEADLRRWLPGSDWDSAEDAYRRPPEVQTIEASVALPANLPAGNYILALSILDPEGGNLPCARFEIKNYWKGGLHPMGRLSVGQPAADPAVDASGFFTEPVDPSLHYEMPGTGLSR